MKEMIEIKINEIYDEDKGEGISVELNNIKGRNSGEVIAMMTKAIVNEAINSKIEIKNLLEAITYIYIMESEFKGKDE